MKVLQLVLTRKWYDMITSGKNKGLTHVCFHLGYNQTKLFAIKEIIEDTGKEKGTKLNLLSSMLNDIRHSENNLNVDNNEPKSEK